MNTTTEHAPGQTIKFDIVVGLDRTAATYLMDQTEAGPIAVAQRLLGLDRERPWNSNSGHIGTAGVLGESDTKHVFWLTLDISDDFDTALATFEKTYDLPEIHAAVFRQWVVGTPQVVGGVTVNTSHTETISEFGAGR